MRINVHLHGYLAAFHNGPISVVASTAAEAVELVTRQLAGFRPNAKTGRKRIKVVGCEMAEDLYKPWTDADLHIVPQFNGGKSGGWTQILIGIALIAASFIPGVGVFFAGLLLKTGALMLLGGIAQLLAPQPDDSEASKSRYLGSPKNTVAIGTRIPILYGRARVYGQILSFDITAREFIGPED